MVIKFKRKTNKLLYFFDINTEEIKFPLSLLINLDMLSCCDYLNKVKAFSILKNGKGCFHLFDKILKPNFLKSENYYQDIEMLSKADTARYGLWLLGEDSFINSPYHKKDLKLIIEAKNTNKENHLDFIVIEALVTVASNIDSIKSPYHRAGMNLIVKTGSNGLQICNSYCSINNLATNNVSLNDKYHSENMQILANNTFAREFLYIIMTDENIIKSKNYRKEVEALANAKSENTAKAIYYYIVNPSRKYKQYIDFHNDSKIDYYENPYMDNKYSIEGNKNPNNLHYLKQLNEISDRLVMHYVSILMNFKLINTEFIDYDLNLLKNTLDVSTFMDLYKYIFNENSLKNQFHKSNIELIKTKNAINRNLLLEKIIDEYSLKNINRTFDLNYISSLDISNIDSQIFKQMRTFYFLQKALMLKTINKF